MLQDGAVELGHEETIPFAVDTAMDPMGFLIKDSNMIGFLNVLNATGSFPQYYLCFIIVSLTRNLKLYQGCWISKVSHFYFLSFNGQLLIIHMWYSLVF